MFEIKIPAKASIWYIAASTLGKAANVLILPFITRLIGQEEYGRLGVYMALLGAASVICSPFISGTAIYKGIKEHENNKKDFINAVIVVGLSFSVILCILLFAFSSYFHIEPILFIPLSLQIFCDVIVTSSLSLKRFYYQYKTVATMTVISSVIPPIASIILLAAYKIGYTVRIYALLLVSFCLAIYSIVCIVRSFGKPKREIIKYIIHHSAPMLPHSISTAIFLHADKLILSGMLGATALAKYNIVYSLGSAMQFTVSAIASALGPWVIRRLCAKENNRITQLITPAIIGYTALSVCLVAISPEAILILAPAEYADALPALLPIALSTSFNFVNTIINTAIVYSGKEKYFVILSLINAAICISSNFILIGSLGYLGAGATLLLCQIVSTIIGIYFLKHSGIGNMIPIGITALTFGVGIILSCAVFAYQNSIIMRTVLLILPAIALIFCVFKAKDLLLEKKKIK